MGLLTARARRTAQGATLLAALNDTSNPLLAALSSLHTNCFIADPDLNLVWANRLAHDTLVGLAPAIQTSFGVTLQDLLDGSIHRFHQDPARIERILHDPSALPRTAVFSFGGVTLRTMINVITDIDGGRLGYIVVWDNVSDRNAQADATFAENEVVTARLDAVSRSLAETAGDTSQQATNAAEATEQMNAAVQEIARASSEASQQVQRTVDATAQNLQQLRRLQAMSNEIGGILRIIETVAGQTKMLALNATIEAARAGEAGKGFAVVADEVKQLAETTTASISDIENKIKDIQQAADASAEATAGIDTLVDRIRESQETIAAAIEEQSATTASIAGTISVIAETAQLTSSQAMEVHHSVISVQKQTTVLRELIKSS
ncbi:methyl-accepting chemotaxis protein [Kineosporia sp. NBRC 101731]|uniref:methyl-accepting chemotaxis protein n=1 Tax=Kineosporia sp. NBRC 101731 TaxID=3032199 RepID=UPI0025576287|nr:methyl-accepting chemotaxis protein [Kineosporia sp. NBRC 101731]